MHRSLHAFSRLWWFHALHHDTPQMHILKSGRLHFGEDGPLRCSSRSRALPHLHHSQDRRFQDSNYSGSTPIWDVLFGTFSHPDRCKADPLGLSDSPKPHGFPAQVLFPFRAQLQPPSALPIRSAKLST